MFIQREQYLRKKQPTDSNIFLYTISLNQLLFANSQKNSSRTIINKFKVHFLLQSLIKRIRYKPHHHQLILFDARIHEHKLYFDLVNND